jgi:hypothetical protein
MPLNMHPHEFAEHPETHRIVLIRVTPYVRLTEGREAIYLQAGQVFTEEGPAIPEERWPDWLPGALLRLNKKAAEEAGFQETIQKLNAPDDGRAPDNGGPPKGGRFSRRG